jgi:hypothetical protein
MAGIGAMTEPSVGGSDFAPDALQSQGLRERDDFVFQPSATDENDVQLNMPPAAAGSGFALDESDRVAPVDELDLGELAELQAEEQQPPGKFDFITDDPNAPPDPSLRFRHTDMPHEQVAPMLTEHTGFVVSEEEERVASEIDLASSPNPVPVEEVVALDLGDEALHVEEVEEAPVLDLNFDEPKFGNVTDDPNAPPDPGLHFRHTEMPEEHVAPLHTEHAGFMETEAEEREASEIDLLPTMDVSDVEAVDEEVEAIIPIDDEGSEELAIDLDLNDLDPEGTLAFGEEPPAAEPPKEEPKKDGGPNFDFLK